mmetsp:Transcript_6131/g.26047  ORF Transcript_6131/g.26047 Transcript_6131/m.26047 type:complete len:145 (+) Transcript_6131:988-1422(+)
MGSDKELSSRRGGSHSAADARAAGTRAPRAGAPRRAANELASAERHASVAPPRFVATDGTVAGTRAPPRAGAGAARRARRELACTRRGTSGRTPEAHAVDVTLIPQTSAEPVTVSGTRCRRAIDANAARTRERRRRRGALRPRR